MGRLFGTDGVRGLANVEITPELAFKLGQAGAYIITKETNHTPRIIIGMDTRRSKDMLEAALVAGMCSIGADVFSAGVIPTPAIAYLVKHYNYDAGVMISASHNPFYDNGIKFFNADGYKLKDELEDEIENFMETLDFGTRVTGDKVGVYEKLDNALDDYILHLKNSMIKDPDIKKDNHLSGMKIAMDCANGATYQAAPILLCDLGAQVFVTANEPNGININDNCGSTHISNLAAFMKETKADIGVAFDGDGDRLCCVDENGNVLDGDQILSIVGNVMKDSGELAHDTIVATVMSNLGFLLMGEKTGINIEKTKVGDRYVLERMLEGGFNLGGENSGHMIFLDDATTGDGILSALKLINAMKTTGKTLSELNQYMELLPQVLINAKIPNDKKQACLDDKDIIQEIDKLEKLFSGNGRVLIRPSGTEPLVRVMIEGKDIDIITKEAKRLADMMELKYK